MSHAPTPAFIALGANLGDRLAHLRRATARLAQHPGVTLVAASPVYESPAHTLPPHAPQPPYLNAVLHLNTALSPQRLLALLHNIEREAGRDREQEERWAARTLDLDLLLYGDTSQQAEAPLLPHPRLGDRRFVLQPLADLAPSYLVPPPFSATVAHLLARCPDTDPLQRQTEPLWPPPPLVLPENLRYVVVEGVIGVGKTTLARLLTERFDGQLIFEEFEENPFLARFYEDRERWAFQTQLAFLASRFRQQQALVRTGGDLFHPVRISDYAFDKDRIFAQINLDGDELQLYETLYALMRPATPAPDLVVYLQASHARLMQQIRKRGRSYEQDMDPDYIATLIDAYDQYFARYDRSPLLIVNMDHLDFVAQPQDFEALLHRIITGPRTGTTHFNPAPASLPLL